MKRSNVKTKKKNTKTKSKQERDDRDLLTIRLGTAGVGRLRFKAYLDMGNDGRFDRQDGSDLQTYPSPGAALAALGRRIDHASMLHGWLQNEFSLDIANDWLDD